MTAIRNKNAYADKNPISDNDFLVGTNGDTIKKETKSFPVSALRNYLISGLSPETGGTLKVTEIVYEGVLTTPEEVANALNPSHIIQRYEVVILNVNGDKYQLKLQNIVIGLIETPVTNDDFIPISLVASNLSESISFYKGFNLAEGREEFYSIGSVGFSITKELDEDEVETGVIFLEQKGQTNLGGGVNIYKWYNPATYKQEYYTLYSSDSSVTFTKEIVSGNETGRISITASLSNTNFAITDLTFTANRVHNLDSKTVYYNNAKQIKSNVNVIQPAGEASFEEKGYGTTVADIIKRIKNSADAIILEIRGNKSVKFFGNVFSNGLSNLPSNTVFGEDAFITNSTGLRNTAFGTEALRNATENDNSAFGNASLRDLTTGIQNTAIGYESCAEVTTGVQNVGIGYDAMYKSAGASSFNTVIGFSALSRTEDEVFTETANNCTIIGNAIKTKSGNLNPINQIIIGSNSVGEGDNTIVIGNENSEVAYLPRHTTTEINAFIGMTKGAEVFNTTLNTKCFYDGTIWQKVTSSAM